MPSKTKIKVTLDFLTQTTKTEEDLFRELAHKLVQDMPFNELCLIFGFSKLQPETEEFNKVYYDTNTPFIMRQFMYELKFGRVAIFEAEVRNPERLLQIEYYQNPSIK